MLDRIIEHLESNPGPVTAGELARKLGVQKSAVVGMLDFLERKGRLSFYRPDECAKARGCEGCVYRGSCSLATREE